MRIRRDVLVSAIIRYQNSFLKLLDAINTGSGGYDVPSSLYLHLYNKEILVEAAKQNDLNASEHLSIDSLHENGIFVYYSKHTGNLTLHQTIVDLLRYIDVTRARALNREDFELLRSQIESAVANVMRFDTGTEHYAEAMEAFNTVINETLSKFRGNVEKLMTRVEDVAIEYKKLEQRESKIDFVALYETVQYLYRKFVLPCYEFIDPRLQLISKRTFAQSLDDLIDFHEERDFQTVASQIGYSKTAVTSYFKDVGELEGKLKQYSNTLESERNFFISIENSFALLMKDVNELRHGKQKGYMLSNKSEIFGYFGCLDGIAQHSAKQEPTLHWTPHKTAQRFDEFLRVVNDKGDDSVAEKSVELVPVPDSIDIEVDRKIIVSNLLIQFNADDGNDIHAQVYEYLKTNLESCDLMDLLYGLEVVYGEYEEQIANASYERKRLEDTQYFMEYLPIRLNRANNHV